MIVIVDFKMGNLRSVEKAFQHLGFEAEISGDPADIPQASHLVLPGDGAFGKSVENIKKLGFLEPIQKFIDSGRPFLGICVGFQVLYENSIEMGEHEGLGMLKGSVIKFPPGRKIPHMGWNQVALTREHPLSVGIPDNSYFYFVHSYYAENTIDSEVIGKTEYGPVYCSIAAHNNLHAVQFHPEKSQEAGLRLLKNFAEMK